MGWRHMVRACIAIGVVASLTGCPAGSKTTAADIDFVWCPSGEFYMGNVDGDDNEFPVHHVELTKGFWISSHEITQEQWTAFMDDNPSDMTGDPRLPVENVSWNEVQTYIAALGDAHPLRKFRLPTEAEWEYACRAGSETDYFFGSDASGLLDYAWYAVNASNRTQLVGQKAANDWGLYDIYGNVGEWVGDWYADYDQNGGTETDPEGPTTGSKRVHRGGSWDNDATSCRSSKRFNYSPDKRSNKIGFRLVME